MDQDQMNQEQLEDNREPDLVFDWTEAVSISVAVISAVAEISEEDPLEMEPLHSAVDTDSLDGLFDSHGFTPLRRDIRVEFTYNGCVVQVSGTGNGSVFCLSTQWDD